MIKQVFKTMVALLAIAAAAAGPVRGQNTMAVWPQTAYGDLQTGDTVVILDKTSAKALPSTASSTTPSTVLVTLNSAKDTLTSTPAANLLWVVTKNGNTYQFKQPGSSNYLYFIDYSNGVRVGNSNDNQFTFQIGGAYNVPFLKHNATSSYLGLNDAGEWRSAGSISSTSNIKNTVIGFYKKTVIIIPTYTVRFASGNDGWQVQDVTASSSATAPAILQNVMAGDSLVVTAPASLPGKVKSVKAVKYVPPVLVQSIVLNKQTASLAKDSTMTLSVASVLPENAADKSYSWSSDAIAVADVDQNGVVIGHNAGTANIIATANDGSGAKDTCVVTVLSPAILDGVTVLYVSNDDNWSTVMGYNPGLMYQDNDKVRLTSNGAFLYYDGHPLFVDDLFYPGINGYQWLRVVEIGGSQFYYHQGETWQDAIDANRQDNHMWSINDGKVIFHGDWILVDTNSEPVDPTATIDPSTVDYDLYPIMDN